MEFWVMTRNTEVGRSARNQFGRLHLFGHTGWATLVLAMVTILTQSAVAATYTYDELSRLTRVDYGNGQTVDYGYDAAGNRLTRVVVAPNTVRITLGVAPTGGGTVSGGGAKVIGSTVTVKATPAVDYHFVNWTEAGLMVSGLPSYSFPATAARSLVANFAAGGNGLLTLTPTALSFPGQAVGTGSEPQAVNVANTGTATLSLVDISASGDFGQINACDPSLAAGTSCNVLVTFNPVAPGTRKGLLSVASSVGTKSATLTGEGLAVAAVTLSDAAVHFGSHGLYTPTAVQEVTLTNTGTAALELGETLISGDFDATTSCAATLAVGASCSYRFTFTPGGVGLREGLLLVDSNAPGAPHMVLLSGFGAVATDLDAGGQSDVVWRNGVSGENSAWFVDVSTDLAIEPVVFSAPIASQTDLLWRIACAADHNADASADLLWRYGQPGETATGANSVWLMDGTTILRKRTLDKLADLNWQVAGCGDLDGDGRSDIVWRHATTGEDQVWLLDVTTDLAVPPVKLKAAIDARTDPLWRIAGVGDFNADGNADILWRHGLPGETATGANAVWFMDGTRILGKRSLNKLADLNWVVAGTGDFDADGRMDMVWRNVATGSNRVWLLNATTDLALATLKAAAAIELQADLLWRIVQVGDYDGDGKADLFWRHGQPGETATGANEVWLMDGFTVRAKRTLDPITDLNWQTAP